MCQILVDRCVRYLAQAIADLRVCSLTNSGLIVSVLMSESSTTLWYRATSMNHISQWQSAVAASGYEFAVVVPEVGDWVQLLPCTCSNSKCICNGWQNVRMVPHEGRHGATVLEGWVPPWLLSHGCTWCYPPVAVQLPLAPSPLAPSPPVDQVLESNVLSDVFGDKNVWGKLLRIAAQYADTFDWDLPREERTSELVQRIQFQTPTVKGPFPVSTVERFAYVDPEEWFAYDISTLVDMRYHEAARMRDHWSQSENMSQLQLFHGTVLGAACGMIGVGGFIPGPGKCRKNSRRVSGAFCATSFADALEKGMGHQLDYAEDAGDCNKKLNMFCMPVVVELQAIDWHPTHMHSSKYCFEAPPGFAGVLPGVIIKRLFINKILVQNFKQHGQHVGVRPELADPFMVRVCGQNASKFQTPLRQATCGRILYASDWNSIVKSTAGFWYCRACAKFRVHHNDMMVYRLPDHVDGVQITRSC